MTETFYYLFPICFLTIIIFIYYRYIVFRVNKFVNLDLNEFKAEGSYIKLRGVNIHYVERGNKGKSIVFIHGLGANIFTFRYSIQELSKYHKVYALDLKGHGYSERMLNSDYTLIEQARVLLDFIIKKKIRKVIAIGHSMGGEIVLLAYNLCPDKFEKLILIDGLGFKNRFRFILALVNHQIINIVYYKFFIKRPNFIKILRTLIYNNLFINEDIIVNYLTPFKIKNSNKVYLKILKGFMNGLNKYDIKNLLGKISIPALIIWGKNDKWINVNSAYGFNNYIKNSSLEIIKKAGHDSVEEKHQIVNKILIDFIDK